MLSKTEKKILTFCLNGKYINSKKELRRIVLSMMVFMVFDSFVWQVYPPLSFSIRYMEVSKVLVGRSLPTSGLALQELLLFREYRTWFTILKNADVSINSYTCVDAILVLKYNSVDFCQYSI